MAKENTDSNHRPKFLFFGELPPAVVHGVSLSNKINTDILAEMGDLQIVEEKWSLKDHERFALRKVKATVQSAVALRRASKKGSPALFYSVLYVSALGGFKNLLSILAVKMGNRETPLVLHVHRSDLKEVISGNAIYRGLIRIFNRFGVTFIVLSETQKEEVAHYLDRVEVLYNAIDEEEIFPIPNQKKKKPFRFLFLSNYIKEKGILDLIAAFPQRADFPDLHLNCYGGFTDKETEQQIKKLTIGRDEITIHDAVYGEKKNEVINEADAVVLPSYNEGFPLVVLESLRLNKPVIVSKVGYISEIFGDDYPLYCIPGDIESLNSKLRDAVELESNVQFQNSLEEIYRRYSLSNHRLTFESIINGVIS